MKWVKKGSLESIQRLTEESELLFFSALNVKASSCFACSVHTWLQCNCLFFFFWSDTLGRLWKSLICSWFVASSSNVCVSDLHLQLAEAISSWFASFRKSNIWKGTQRAYLKATRRKLPARTNTGHSHPRTIGIASLLRTACCLCTYRE